MSTERPTTTPQSLLSAEQFWQFSLALYPKLQTELLALQDQYNCNINLLLLTAWLAQLPTLPVLLQALCTANPATQTLRQLRRTVTRQQKDHQPDELLQQFRQQLLHTELMSERLEQRALVHACQTPTLSTIPALTLRQLYLDSHQVPAAIQQQLTFDLDQALLQLQLPAQSAENKA